MMMMTTIIMMKKKSKTLVHPAATQYFVQMALLHFGYKYPIWMCELGERKISPARVGGAHKHHIHRGQIYISRFIFRTGWDLNETNHVDVLCAHSAINHITHFPLHAWAAYMYYINITLFFLHSISLSFSRSIEFVYANMNMSMSMNECCCYHFPTIIYINKKTC